MRISSFMPTFVLALAAACSSNNSMSSANGKKNSPTEESKKTDLTQTDGSLDEESALPPQSIAGAYLTCDVPAKTNTNDAIVYGCSVFNAADAKLDLSGIAARWDVVDDNGHPVPKEELTDPGAFDKAWVIAQKDTAFGLNGQLTVPVADGNGTEGVIEQAKNKRFGGTAPEDEDD